MIDVVFADHNELFHAGMKKIVGATDDLHLVAQPRCAKQLLSILASFIPHVLVLSTKLLPAFWEIEPFLQRRQTALLLLAEENDRVAYVRWLRAQGVVYRSMNGPVLIDALRRVARGEVVLQSPSSDAQKEPPTDTTEKATGPEACC